MRITDRGAPARVLGGSIPAKAFGAQGALHRAGAIPWFHRDDLNALALLPIGLLVAWCSPERYWRYFVGGFAGLRRAEAAWLRGQIRALVEPGRLAMPIDAIVEAYLANWTLPKLQTLRLLAPQGWRPAIDLAGREHVERALAEGRGAVLWIAPFLFSPLLSKMALHQAGFAVSHLSRYSHGFSGSAFGARYLNPLRTGIERRYIERIVIGPDGSVTAAVRALRRRLADNRLVSITVTEQGTSVLAAPVFDGVVNVAAGAPKLALRSGASLLPVVAIRGPSSRFVIHVDRPIRAPEDLGHHAAAAAMAAELGRRLERYIVRCPEQFAWRYLKAHPSP